MQDNPEVERGKIAMREQFGLELERKLGVLCKAQPKLTLEQALGELKTKEPGFFARLERIERGDWSAAGTGLSHSGPVSSFSTSGKRLNAATIGEGLPLPSVVRAEDEPEHLSAADWEQFCREVFEEPEVVQATGETWVCIGPSTSIWAALE